MKDYKVDIEDLKPVFIEEGLKRLVSPIILYRANISGSRFYYTLNQKLEPKFYLGGTSFSNKVLPTSIGFVNWKMEMGKEASHLVAERTAQYGTFMHILFGKFLINGEYEPKDLAADLIEYMESERIPLYHLKMWLPNIEADLLAFAQWCYDYQVTPLAIEYPICNEDTHTGTLIDLVCEMTIQEKGFHGVVYKSGPRKGQPRETKKARRVKAIIDFKSGRKGFYETHELQLALSKAMWNAWFGHTDYKVEKTFNWSPKDWRTSPDYNFKDQTGSKYWDALEQYVQLMHKWKWHIPSRKFKYITNKLVLGQTTEYEIRTLDTIVNEKHILKSKFKSQANG